MKSAVDAKFRLHCFWFREQLLSIRIILCLVTVLFSHISQAEILRNRRHSGRIPAQRQVAQNIITPLYNFFYLGGAASKEICRNAAISRGATHFYFGQARFQNGVNFQDACFAAALRGSPPPVSLTSMPQSPPETRQRQAPPKSEAVHVWTREPNSTPVTENVAAVQSASDALIKKMGQAGEEPIDPKGPWSYQCLRINTNEDPFFKPFFSMSFGMINRTDLFKKTSEDNSIQFGDFKYTRKTNESGFTNFAEFAGSKHVIPVSELHKKAAPENDPRIEVTVDTEAHTELKFFHSPSGEPFGIGRFKNNIFYRRLGSKEKFPTTASEDYCIYRKQATATQDLLSAIKAVL